jgi:signal transduction histidine kinase
MKKIMAVSKKLSSSTFEFFGLTEGIHELIYDFGNISPVQIELDETSFSEEDTNPDVRLLLFRILEDKLSLITGSLKTDKIRLALSNQSSVANLSITFQCFDPDINELLNQTKLIDIKSKLEMYGGTMQIKNLPGNNYKIEVIV